DLCGHATLAAAFVLKQLAASGHLPATIAPFWRNSCVTFVSRSGPLMAESSADGITLDFPATPVHLASVQDDLLDSLGVAASEVVFFGRTAFDLFVHVSSAAAVRRIAPKMEQLAKYDARGIIVTSSGDTSDHDVISRFFAPAAGVDEDPVTGSAHCALAWYWAPEFGRATLFGYQASRRGGHVRMELRGDRVRLTGHAILVSCGELLV
ncbi:MAG: PhzF family phenazine biosynthesis protein, partial [Planctomycetota bacterium]